MAIGHVRLRVGDPETSATFYEGLGMVSEVNGEEVCLRPRGGDCVIYLSRKYPLPVQENYVYHVALLLKSRQHLATVAKLINIEGVADHGVTESIYSRDLDGVGLEFYVDKPRTLGEGEMVEMGVYPLDLTSLLEEPLVKDPMEGVSVGHVHLRVSNVAEGIRFYSLLGLRLVGKYMGAAFLAKGNYHHHVALNSWPVPRPPVGIGLSGFSIVYGNDESLRSVAKAVGASLRDGVAVVKDPFGFLVELVA